MKKLLLFLFLIPFISQAQRFVIIGSMQKPGSATITPSGSLSAFSTNVGTASSSQNFTFTGTSLTANVVWTAGSGMEVSSDNSTFSSTATYTQSGGSASGTVYVRIAAATGVGSYSGNISGTSTGAATANVAYSATVNAFITPSPTSITGLNGTAGSAGTPQTVTVTFAGATFTATAPSGTEVSKDGGSTYASSQTFSTGSPLALKIRVAASASAGSISGNLALTGGPSTVNVSISGTVSGGGGGATFKAVTIDHTKVANTDQTNFPMSFDITRTDLKSISNGGSVANNTKNNIAFYADNAGVTPLNFQIVTWDATTGHITGTVMISTLSHTTNNVIYLGYGDPSISTNQSAGSPWDANYLRSWSMDDVLTGSGQNVTDQTTNAANMTSAGSWTSAQSVAGKIGNGLKLLSSNSTYMTFSSLSLTSTYTIEGWYNPTSATVDDNTVAFDHDPFSSPNDNELAWGNAAGYVGLFTTGGNNKVQSSGISGGNPWPSNAWHHLVITRTGTSWTMYIDGASNQTSSQATDVNFNTLGHDGSFTTNDLIVDELRVSNVVRSADWITTEYNNQSSPSTFYSIAP